MTNDEANDILLIITIQWIISKLCYHRIEMSQFVFALYLKCADYRVFEC